MAADGTGGGAATVNTNDISISSGQGVLDFLQSQGSGLGTAIADNLWLLVGLGVSVLVVILLWRHFG